MVDTRRFVILSSARSGTSLLTSSLNHHPDIVCHGELFHPNISNHVRGNLSRLSTPTLLALRENSDQFLKAAFNQPDTKAVGFKMWQDQSEKVCRDLLVDSSVFKIIYERKNKLAQWSSKALAKQTGVWNLNASSKITISTENLSFDSRSFVKSFKNQNARFQYYRENSVGHVLDITYSEVVEHGFENVLSFLGVPLMPLKVGKRRLHPDKIIDRYKPEFHAEIKDCLEEIGHPEWISE